MPDQPMTAAEALECFEAIVGMLERDNEPRTAVGELGKALAPVTGRAALAVLQREIELSECAPTVKGRSVVAKVTHAVRASDKVFQRVGGSSRHWVRDCFLPALAMRGIDLERPSPLTEAQIREALEKASTECDKLGFIATDNDYAAEEITSRGIAAILEAQRENAS